MVHTYVLLCISLFFSYLEQGRHSQTTTEKVSEMFMLPPNVDWQHIHTLVLIVAMAHPWPPGNLWSVITVCVKGALTITFFCMWSPEMHVNDTWKWKMSFLVSLQMLIIALYAADSTTWQQKQYLRYKMCPEPQIHSKGDVIGTREIVSAWFCQFGHDRLFLIYTNHNIKQYQVKCWTVEVLASHSVYPPLPGYVIVTYESA